jgi:hypothetical protein
VNDEYFGLIFLDLVSTNRERREGRKRVTSISLELVRKRNHNMKINRIFSSDGNGFMHGGPYLQIKARNSMS